MRTTAPTFSFFLLSRIVARKGDYESQNYLVRIKMAGVSEISQLLSNPAMLHNVTKEAFASVDTENCGVIDESKLKQVMQQVCSRVGCPPHVSEAMTKMQITGSFDLQGTEILVKHVLTKSQSLIGQTYDPPFLPEFEITNKIEELNKELFALEEQFE